MKAMCAETLFERLEPGIALPSMSQPEVNPVVTSPAPRQPEAAVVSQQIPVQTVQPRLQTPPVVPTLEQNTSTSYLIPAVLRTTGFIKVTMSPSNQPRPVEFVVQRPPQVQEIDRIEQERERQEKINQQKQQMILEGERLLKEQEEFEKQEERKKKEEEEDRIRQIMQREAERHRKEQEELARQKKIQEENERRMKEELDKQRKRQEEIMKQQRQRAEQERKKEEQQERLREHQRLQEEQLQKQLKERNEAIRQNQQAIIPSAPIQPKINVVNLKHLQQQKDQNRQSNQPQRVQLPEQRPVARLQQSIQQPQRSYVQPLASPRQSQKQPTRTPIPQQVGLQVVAPLNVHDPAMWNLLQETPELTLMGLRRDALNVDYKYSVEGKKIKATVTFRARWFSDRLKLRLVNCCFQPWLIDSLPITCSDWETIIKITIMAIFSLEKNELKIFFDKMRAANLDASLTGFLMQIQRNSKSIFLFPFPKPLEGFDVFWANRAYDGQLNQKDALNDFMRKLTEKGELKPDKTQAGKSIVCVPRMDCHLLQVLANAYTVKYLRKYQENHPVAVRASVIQPVATSVIQPVASTSSATDNNDVMVINPNASFLPPGPGVTHQQQSVRTVSLAHSGNLVSTTVVTQMVHHLPTSTLPHQPYRVGDVMGDMVQQMVQSVQPPPLPLQPPPEQPQPPMVPPPPMPMMNQGQFQNDNYQFARQEAAFMLQNHQYQQPAQTSAWIPTGNGNYGHQSSGQDLSQQGQANNQWYQRQQSQLQNQNVLRTQPPPSYSQQRGQTQGYYPQQYPVQQPQPQQLHWQPQVMFAQQPTASPTVPNHGNANYMQHLGLQFEQDDNTEAVAMDIDPVVDLSLQVIYV